MGNALKKCFGATPKPKQENQQKSPKKSPKAATTTPKAHADKETTPQNEPVAVSEAQEDNNKEENQTPQIKKENDNSIISSRMRLIPVSSKTSQTGHPKNKFSYDVDALFFSKNSKPKKPLNRNLEWYEAKNISSRVNYEQNGELDEFCEDGRFFDVDFLRGPDDIQDQRVTIENCSGLAKFVIADQCDSVQIDDCRNCSFFIGPCSAAVFARNCKNCTFVVLCSQLRLRDCQNCYFSVFTATRPVIESSTGIVFSPWEGPQYLDLRKQMAKAKLSVFNNKWHQIHDFTPSKEAKSNFTLFGNSAEETKAKNEYLQSTKLKNVQVISSLVFSSSRENNHETAIGMSEEEQEMYNTELKTVPRVFYSFHSASEETIRNRHFICFLPGSFEVAIKFCLKLSHHQQNKQNSSPFYRIRHTTEIKLKTEEEAVEMFRNYIECFPDQRANFLQVVTGNVVCCVVVETASESSKALLDITTEEQENFLIHLTESEDEKEKNCIKELIFSLFQSAQANNGKGFGQAFS